MFKFIKDVVSSAARGVALPYDIGEPYANSWGSWTHFRGTSKEDSSPVSIFSFTATNLQDARLAAARNGVKRLRTVRHPNVLSFLYSTETIEAEARPTIYVVTEPVMPLGEKLKELSLQGAQRDEYYAWGLHQIAKAISFLNIDCKLVHGNICLASVVVTPTLDWKLHAFDVLSEFDASNPDTNASMLPFEGLVSGQYKAMELGKHDWSLIRKSPPWAIDAWGLGCLIYELCSNVTLAKSEDLRNTSLIPKNLLADYQRLLGSAPSRRLNPSKFIENSDFFQNKLVETIQFMEILNLKDSMEKDTFFRKLSTLAEQLPRQIVVRKILPMLGSALEFGSASASALSPFLKIGSWLSQEELASKVVPTIVKLFASTDRAIRVGLLQNIEQFGSALSNQVVDEVFVHVATGFSDTSALLRELTLKSVLIFAPKLSQRTITGSLLKYLSKLQVDDEPAIRTNTTILLGNIAGFLNEATRKKVLINAFTVRALRDGFAPARLAGIMALTATSQYYDTTEIACRVLPNIVMFTIDADSEVRNKAIEATEKFLNMVKQSSKFGATAETTVSESSLASTSGFLGWAVSSLTAKPKGPEQVTGGLQTSGSGLSTASSDPIPSSQQSENMSPDHFGSDHEATNDWGNAPNEKEEEGGWDDMEPPEFESLSRIQAAQQRPIVTAAKPQVNGQRSVAPSSTAPAAAHYDAPIETKQKLFEDDDPWAELEAAAPVTKRVITQNSSAGTRATVRQAQHVSLGLNSGTTAKKKLGAQRVTRPANS